MLTENHSSSYLTFTLNNEFFAVNVSRVLEILELKPITRVPNAPAFMRGVINLRGNILPVIDTRKKFDMPDAEFTVDTCIIVLNVYAGRDALLVGALVDSVQKVIEIPEQQIQASPGISGSLKADFIKGIGRVEAEEQFIMILNSDNVFAADEVLL